MKQNTQCQLKILPITKDTQHKKIVSKQTQERPNSKSTSTTAETQHKQRHYFDLNDAEKAIMT